MAAEKVVDPDFDVVALEHHRAADRQGTKARRIFRHRHGAIEAPSRLARLVGLEYAIKLRIESIERVSVERRKDGDAEAELRVAVLWQHPDRHDVEILRGRRLVQLPLTSPGTGDVPLPQAHDFDHDIFRLNRNHQERAEAGNVVDIIEPDDGEIVGAGVHLDDEAICRDGDYLAYGAFAVIAAHSLSPPAGGASAFLEDIASSTLRIASSMRSLGRCGINSSMIVSK